MGGMALANVSWPVSDTEGDYGCGMAWATGRIPLLATLIILGRDLLLVLGYKFLVPRGYAFEVSFLGKAATWVLYASLCVVIVTAEGTLWPLVLLWFGIVLALIAGIQY